MLENVQQKVERALTHLFHDDELWISGNYENRVISELNSVKDLVSVCLPIQRNSTEDPFTSESCPILWQQMYSYIEDKLKIVDMFSNLVFHLILNEAKERYCRMNHCECY